MPLTKKTDYVAEGKGYLRQGLKGRKNISALLGAFLAHSQSIEDALAGLQNGLLLANAKGAALDNIGEIVGASRNGLDDDTFRLYIRAQIAANHGDATIDAVVQLAQSLFAADLVFARSPLSTRRDGGAQGAYLALAIGSAKLPARLFPLVQTLLRANVGGGVALEWVAHYAGKKAFAFAGTGAWVGGFGSIYDPSAGAPMASLVAPASA